MDLGAIVAEASVNGSCSPGGHEYTLACAHCGDRRELDADTVTDLIREWEPADIADLLDTLTSLVEGVPG